jgi:hypothetical protein
MKYSTRDGSGLAFQHQNKRRRVAAHAMGRAAKQLLHVSNLASGRHVNNNDACSVAERASNCRFDCIKRDNRQRRACGGGRRLHSAMAIVRVKRVRTEEHAKQSEDE